MCVPDSLFMISILTFTIGLIPIDRESGVITDNASDTEPYHDRV